MQFWKMRKFDMLKTKFSLESFTQELNEKQKTAVIQPLKYCTKIVAGAGTGKTKIISKRFVKLVFDLIDKNIENPLSHILVITFTKKAANEMKERIVKELAANGIEADGEDLWISTFHGFGNKFLKRHAIEANLSNHYKMSDEISLKKIWNNLIKKIEYSEMNLIENYEIIAQNLNINKDILLIGNLVKLSSILDLENIFEYIFQIIKKIKSLGLSPRDFINKTKKSTNEFSQKIRDLPFEGKSKEEFFANWSNHLKRYQDDFCSDDYFEKLASESSVLCKNGSRKPEAWTIASTFQETLAICNEMEMYLIEVVGFLYALYQNELETLNIVDFDDLINKPVEILQTNNDLRNYYQNFFEHIIIDEFQDTNGAQLELIKLLLPENAPNITFVGDRKQSIYAFRFAQMENLDTLQEFIEKKYNKKYLPVQLETNYRSSAKVLDVVNAVTKYQLKLDEPIYPPVGKRNSEKDVKKTTLTNLKDSYEHNLKEANYIAETILELKEKYNVNFSDFAILVQSHKMADFFDKELSKYGIDCTKAVNTDFFRNPVTKNILALLKMSNNFFDEQSFVRLLQIKLSDSDILELKKFADSKIYVSEYKDSIKSMNLNEKVYYIYSNGFLNTEYKNFAVIDYVTKIFTLFEEISRNFKKETPLAIFYKIMNEIKPYCAKTEKEIIQNEKTIKIIEKLIADFENSQNFVSISSLLSYFENVQNEKSFELPEIETIEPDAVKLMTIYSSKGLEFEHVFINSIKNSTPRDKSPFILDLQYGDKPGFGFILKKLGENKNPKTEIYSKLWETPRKENERLRLFYVALSRARNYMDLICFEKYSKTKPALFVEDLII